MTGLSRYAGEGWGGGQPDPHDSIRFTIRVGEL